MQTPGESLCPEALPQLPAIYPPPDLEAHFHPSFGSSDFPGSGGRNHSQNYVPQHLKNVPPHPRQPITEMWVCVTSITHVDSLKCAVSAPCPSTRNRQNTETDEFQKAVCMASRPACNIVVTMCK